LTATQINNALSATAPFNTPDLNDDDDFTAFTAKDNENPVFALGTLDDPNGDSVTVVSVTFTSTYANYDSYCVYVASVHSIECSKPPAGVMLVRMEIEDVHNLDADKTQMVYNFPITIFDHTTGAIPTSSTGTSTGSSTSTTSTTATSAGLIDSATGLITDPVTGNLIDPVTG